MTARPTTVAADIAIHKFLWSKRNRRDLVVCNQKALAEEFGMPHLRFHRAVGRLVDQDQLRVIAVGSRGLKTFKVTNPTRDKDSDDLPQ